MRIGNILKIAALLTVLCVVLTGCESRKKTLVMATNAEFPPYEYYENDIIRGIDAEIAAAVAQDLGYTLEIKDMAFESVLEAVQMGSVDIGAAALTVNDERKALVDFSVPYTTSSQVVIVPDGSDIASVDGLIGKRIGVQQGTTGDAYSGDIEDATIERYNKGFEAVQALVQEKVDAVIIDREPAKVYVSETEGLKILDESFTEEEYAIAVAKGNEKLLEDVNDSIQKLKSSGQLQEIIEKYISAD